MLITRINFDYESEAFQWDDDAEGSECVKRVSTNNQRYRFNVEAVTLSAEILLGPPFQQHQKRAVEKVHNL